MRSGWGGPAANSGHALTSWASLVPLVFQEAPQPVAVPTYKWRLTECRWDILSRLDPSSPSPIWLNPFTMTVKALLDGKMSKTRLHVK